MKITSAKLFLAEYNRSETPEFPKRVRWWESVFIQMKEFTGTERWREFTRPTGLRRDKGYVAFYLGKRPL